MLWHRVVVVGVGFLMVTRHNEKHEAQRQREREGRAQGGEGGERERLNHPHGGGDDCKCDENHSCHSINKAGTRIGSDPTELSQPTSESMRAAPAIPPMTITFTSPIARRPSQSMINKPTMRVAMVSFVLATLLGSFSSFHCEAFSVVPRHPAPTRVVQWSDSSTTTTALHSTRPMTSASELKKRTTMLGRTGPYFSLDRFGGKVEFGATANLVTQLNGDKATIESWLQDTERIATSIWDEKLIRSKGDSVYELKLMQLQFVTITLQPSVDVKMWTETNPTTGEPTFKLQSVGFEPNLQVLPGMNMDSQAFGILIEVAGELQPTKDGKGVTGKIAFQTSGALPPPMRLLPQPVLKATSDTINQTITQFAIQSFQRGATAKFKEFQSEQAKRR